MLNEHAILARSPHQFSSFAVPLIPSWFRPVPTSGAESRHHSGTTNRTEVATPSSVRLPVGVVSPLAFEVGGEAINVRAEELSQLDRDLAYGRATANSEPFPLEPIDGADPFGFERYVEIVTALLLRVVESNRMRLRLNDEPVDVRRRFLRLPTSKDVSGLQPRAIVV